MTQKSYLTKLVAFFIGFALSIAVALGITLVSPTFAVYAEGGTGGGTYKKGDSVTVTAGAAEEGKEFVCWKNEKGETVSTEKSYTFTVTGETTLTAVYENTTSGGGENAPTTDKKSGLSGGAIAAIVICSVLVAGAGGFAIFWFVIRKRNFAELIAAIKSGFKKE